LVRLSRSIIFEVFLDPPARPTDQRQHRALIKAAQDAQRLFAPTQHLAEQRAKPSAFLTTHRSGLAEAMLEMQRRRELLEPSLGVRRVIAQMQAAQKMADQLARNYRSSIKAIHEEATKWRSLVEPAIRQLDELRTVKSHVTGLADSLVA